MLKRTNKARDFDRSLRESNHLCRYKTQGKSYGYWSKIRYIYLTFFKIKKRLVFGSCSEPNVSKSLFFYIKDYTGNYIYENNALKHFSHPEGYIEVEGSSFKYIYQYTDHLGNVRLNYTNVGTSSSPNLQIREENNYYPFGLKHKGYNTGIIGRQDNFKYNGKELQTEAVNGKRLEWYDYGARNYDPTIGRFFNVDPLADSPMQVDKSPFAYTWNNPINLTDPDGMHPDWVDDGWLTGDISWGFDRFGNITVSGTGSNKSKPDGEYELINGEWVKVSNKGDKIGLDFYHGYDKNGKQLTFVTDGKGNGNFIKNGRSALQGEVRGKEVDWKKIYSEFINGNGPERSVFEGSHKSNLDIKKNYLYKNAFKEFINSGVSKDGGEVNFSYPFDILRTAGNMQVQMMGSFNASFYKIGNRTLSIVQDSKSKTSYYYHLPVTNYSRSMTRYRTIRGGIHYNGVSKDLVIPHKQESTTYQTYIFFN